MAFQEALDHVKQRRSCVNPNDGFMAQLRDYQGILRARCAVSQLCQRLVANITWLRGGVGGGGGGRGKCVGAG